MRKTDHRPAGPELREAYRRLRARYGHQGWWPGDTPFEVCVGAILTQHTAWSNVEQALRRLKTAGAMDARRLQALPEAALAALIRPAGYFRVKAARLRSFLRVLVEEFDADLAALFGGPLPRARERLLAIHGIGPETADSMLLYAGGRATFVIDAYTRRVFGRHGWCRPDVPYEELRRLCESRLAARPGTDPLDSWQDYHAQLVQVGKRHCRPRAPRCPGCPLEGLLPPGGPFALAKGRAGS